MFLVNAQANSQDSKMTQLQEVIIESKLLPTPTGVGGNGARFGESVSIDGNRALVGSPRALEHGVAYIFDYDGSTWIETQLIFPDGINADNRFGSAVSLQDNRAVIADKFNRVNGLFQTGAVYVYELNNGVWSLTQKLIASDAGSGDKFGSSVSLSGDRILIGATDYDSVNNGSGSGAAYIFDFDGSLWQESTILTATAGSSGDALGNAVSLDGNQALVAARNFDDNNNGINTGAAYLFELSGSTWSQTHQFLASDGIDNDDFGSDVSISAGRVLIGADQTNEGFNAAGSAYVYNFDGTLWIETKLLAPDAATGNRFGGTVSIENNRLLVGALNGEISGNDTGSVYIFDYSTGINMWEFTQEVAADDITGSSFFASSIALSGDKLIVGNFNDSDNGSQSGAAYVFELNGTWQQTQKVVTQGAVGDDFGYSITLDGNRALIGAPLDGENGLNTGAAYIFDYVNGQWLAPIKLLASDLSTNFGSSVDLEGDNAIIAANEVNTLSQGKVYFFNYDGTSWNEVALFESVINVNDEFASSVSLSGDKALVGASSDTENGIKSGTTYIYEKITGSWQFVDKLIPSDGEIFDDFGYTVSLFGNRAIVGARNEDDGINSTSAAGAAYIYDYDAINDLWLETKLQISNPIANGRFGTSVDLKNNRAIVGASGERGFNNLSTGAAYVFDYDANTDAWNSTRIFASDGSSQDNFGVSVSLDANRLLIGNHLDDDTDTNAGAAYQFDYDGSTWDETKKYLANDGAKSDYYGFSVSLSGDNALIGAYQDNDNGTDAGSVYTFNIEFVFADGFE